MVDKRQSPNFSFASNTDTLFEELRLAVLWQHPSILFAVHRSIWGQKESMAALRIKLNEIGCVIFDVRGDKDHRNVMRQILNENRTEKTIYFIFNLNSGDPDDQETYRALNMYREQFIEQRIKAVFWLTSREADELPHFAPDFWAFRHRVIEFRKSHIISIQMYLYGLALWYSDQIFGFGPDQEIQSYEQSLNNLPTGPESLSIRAQLLYDLGHAHWRNGNSGEANKKLTDGLALVENGPLADLVLRLANGIAALHFQNSRFEKALKIYGTLQQKLKKEAIPRMNRALVLCAMGKSYEGLIQGKRSVQYAPENPELWNRLGYLYIVAGKLDDALVCYEEAIRLAPNVSAFHESLMMCCHLMSRRQQAMEELEIIQRLGKLKQENIEMFREMLMGNLEKASRILNSETQKGRVSPPDISRNINLKIIMESNLTQIGS